MFKTPGATSQPHTLAGYTSVFQSSNVADLRGCAEESMFGYYRMLGAISDIQVTQ